MGSMNRSVVQSVQQTVGDPQSRSKRLLLVTYPFPPVGGAGVQRVTKFVKYLPRHGWEVSVLTVANPSVPLFDPSLLDDIPANTIIHRARTWEPSYAMKATVSASGDGQKKDRSGRFAVPFQHCCAPP